MGNWGADHCVREQSTKGLVCLKDSKEPSVAGMKWAEEARWK